MTPKEALEALSRGLVFPVWLVIGDERYLREEVVSAIRKACLEPGMEVFNEDKFVAGESRPESILLASNMLPMFAKRRFVLVRNLENWDVFRAEEGADGVRAGSVERPQSPFELIVKYIKSPSLSTCLVLTGAKVDGRRQLSNIAKKEGFFVHCDPLSDSEKESFLLNLCRKKGHPIHKKEVSTLVQLAGTDLSSLVDVIERLSLYVGENQTITDVAIRRCVTRVRTEDVWHLIDALRAKDKRRVVEIFLDCYDPKDRGLPLLGAVAWSVRQLSRYLHFRALGLPVPEAGRRVGVGPFGGAIRLESQSKHLSPQRLVQIINVLAETDHALKGSKRPSHEILECALIRLCDS